MVNGMAKKKSLNIKIIAPISVLAAIGLLVGSYFIGYNIGRNSFTQSDIAFVDNTDKYSDIVGVFQRAYYNSSNMSVESYVVFREDNTCYYVDSIGTGASTTVNFDDRKQQCTYEFNKDTKSGKFSVVYQYGYADDGAHEQTYTRDYNFTFDGYLMIGAASYGRIK